MKKIVLTVATVLTAAAPAYAQTTTAPSSMSGTSGTTGNSTVQSPLGNGSSSGLSGSSIGSPGPTYPGRLQDYSNPRFNSGVTGQNPGLQRK